MVPFVQPTEIPLLPYEKYLIETLGLSEKEYRQFAHEVITQAKRSHPAYSHIPDVRMDATTIAIVSLVVGLASSAASYFLAPKPNQPDYDRRPTGSSRQLGSATGTEIYTPSYGFDSAQELAAYGNIVPIVFTRQSTQVNSYGQTFSSGGVLVSPALVWSRIKSWGSYQIAEIIALVGQGPMAKPDLAGIFLGNSALDSLYNDYFDFYWNGAETSGTNSRLYVNTKVYGSLSIGEATPAGNEAFYAPTREGANQPAFSGAFTPSSQTRFGVYTGIPNGTPVRPDWRVVSVSPDYPQIEQAWTEVQRYVDPYLQKEHPYGGYWDNVSSGMPGTGRNYASRIGVIEHIDGVTGAVTRHTHTTNTDSFGTYWTDLTLEKEVNKGDFIVILIGKNRQDFKAWDQAKDFDFNKYDTDLTDVRSRVDAEMTRYDQLFDLGATFMIGRSTWQVVERPRDRYDPELHSDSGYRIKLKCLEGWSESNRKIGIVSESAIAAKDYIPNADIEEAFYPILKYELGTIQNTRRCDATEIGIKSQVWVRFNGITNFNTIPTPGMLAKQNRDRINLTEGKLTTYAHRVSMFALDVRPSDSETSRSLNRNEGWVNLGPYLFAVIGDSPVDIYSFIRITHPQRGQYEYRLRPFNSAVPTQQSNGDYQVFSLYGNKTPFKNWNVDTPFGTFTVGGRGDFIQLRDFYTHRQMAVNPEDPTTGEDLVKEIQYGYWAPDYTKMDVTQNSVVCSQTAAGSTYNVGDPCAWNTLSNIMSIFFNEDPYFDNVPVGTRRTKSTWNYTRESTRSIEMRITVEAYEQNLAGTSRNRWWRIVDTDVASFSGSWKIGETFSKFASNAQGVQFAFNYTVVIPTRYVESVKSATRLFQQYSGVAEVSHYGDLISRSCDQNPEHEVVYVNECVAEDVLPYYQNCAVAGLRLRSSNNFQQLDQLRCYLKTGISVQRLVENDIGPSNLLTDLAWYLFTDVDTGAGKIVNSGLIDKAALTTTGHYLQANQLFFDDALVDPINIRSWLANIAPSVLCFTSLKNGKFSIEPALPYDSNYLIDANGQLPISAMFTEGNILEDSFELNWLELENRKMFQAVVQYKRSDLNRFPEQRTVVVRYTTADAGELPVEEFTFNHITGDEHAIRVARYFLALRKHVTHSITFKTLPWGLSLEPGAYIRVSTQSSPYNPANNGIVKADGTVVAVSAMGDGSYDVYYWDRTKETVDRGNLVIANGIATNFRDSVFSVINTNATSEVYQIEALDVDTDGIVTIKASNYPVDSNGRSLIARDVLDVDDAFEVIGGNAD